MMIRRALPQTIDRSSLDAFGARLQSRRAFLLQLAGGSLAALFPPVPRATTVDTSNTGAQVANNEDPWQLIGAVQEHLFPSEPSAPGARELNALGFLRSVESDSRLDADERAFVLKGAGWLDDISKQKTGKGFLDLDLEMRETVLREVAASDAGENWISTLLLHIFEALLADPVYGCNPDGIGWKWLGHNPGQPRPNPDKRYGNLGWSRISTSA